MRSMVGSLFAKDWEDRCDLETTSCRPDAEKRAGIVPVLEIRRCPYPFVEHILQKQSQAVQRKKFRLSLLHKDGLYLCHL